MGNGVTQNMVQVFEYGSTPISFRRIGGTAMVNASQMAKGFGKLPKDWLRTEASKEYINMLASDRQISLSQLVQVVKGGNTKQQGTWLHEDVALEFARWLSPRFAIWCNARIKELLQVGITATQPTLEAMLENPQLLIGLAQQLLQQRKANEAQEAQIKAQQEHINILEAHVAEMREQVSYVEHILQSKELVTITQIAADYGMSAIAFNQLLHELKVQYKVNGQWILFSTFAAQGYTQSITHQYQRSNGSYGSAMHTYWRQSGRLWLYNLLKERKGLLPLIERETNI